MRPVLFISKRLFLSVILILIGLSLHGQNEKKYYAIDGTEWGRQSDRDKKEQLMWEKIDLDLKEALAIGRLGHTKGEENYKKFKTLF